MINKSSVSDDNGSGFREEVQVYFTIKQYDYPNLHDLLELKVGDVIQGVSITNGYDTDAHETKSPRTDVSISVRRGG